MKIPLDQEKIVEIKIDLLFEILARQSVLLDLISELIVNAGADPDFVANNIESDRKRYRGRLVKYLAEKYGDWDISSLLNEDGKV